jgi:hypothetical protein
MSTGLLVIADAMMAQLDELLPPDDTPERRFERTMVASYVAARLAGPPQRTSGVPAHSASTTVASLSLS